MRYNSKCTVWHKTANGYTELHYPCWWQDTEAVNISRSGKTDVDSALVHLPVDAIVAKNDYIAFGEVDFEFESVSELLKAVKPLKVTTASPKTYGSEHMRHTELILWQKQ